MIYLVRVFFPIMIRAFLFDVFACASASACVLFIVEVRVCLRHAGNFCDCLVVTCVRACHIISKSDLFWLPTAAV